MRLQDALAAKRYFRREGWNPGLVADQLFQTTCYDSPVTCLCLWNSQEKRTFPLTTYDLLADDWQLIEPQVTLSSSSYWDAVKRCGFVENASQGAITYRETYDIAKAMEQLAVKLGLAT